MAALVGISLGTLYQKRYYTSMPLLSGAVIQYIAAGMLLGMGALLFETRQVEWSITFVLTLGWLVLILSIAAILLLMVLIKKGEASRVASLFLSGATRDCATSMVAVRRTPPPARTGRYGHCHCWGDHGGTQT